MNEEETVGFLHYFTMQGQTYERVNYQDAERMRQALQADLARGRAVYAVVYRYPGTPLAITPEWFADHCRHTAAGYSVKKGSSRRTEREARR